MIRQSTFAYTRTLCQHMLAVLLIGTAYVFSSLRRLCAIGMFAFDVSSWCLHALQICMNAPSTSRLHRPHVVRTLHRGLVIPVFVWTRFVVWPALWYSAMRESSFWLAQLEKTLVPGAALAVTASLSAFMIVIMGLTVMYFRRLLHHPHLQRIYLQQQQQQQ